MNLVNNENLDINPKSLLELSERYKENLEEDINIILERHIQLINEYILLFLEHPPIEVKKINLVYLYLNGIKTIDHVFLFVLLLTNNLNLSEFYLQKSYYLYTEFISQIDNLNHSHLNLTGKDATKFVYKKTIYELSNNSKKEFKDNQKNKFNIIRIFLNIIYKLNELILEDYNDEDFKEKLKKFKNISSEFFKNFSNLFLKDIYIKDEYNIGNNLTLFLDRLLEVLIYKVRNEEINLEDLFRCLITVINKIKKTENIYFNLNNLTISNIEKNLIKIPKKLFLKIFS